MRFSRRTRARVLSLAVAALTVGCGDDKASGANKDTSSADGGSQPAKSTRIEAAKGGTVSYDSVTLDIPAGALAKDTEITVTVVDGSTLPDAKLLAGDVYDLGPDGTQFLKPVTLTFDLGDAQLAKDDVPTMGYLEKNGWRWLDDSAWRDGKVVATTTHFTRFGVVRRTASVAPAPVDDAGTHGGADASATPDTGAGSVVEFVCSATGPTRCQEFKLTNHTADGVQMLQDTCKGNGFEIGETCDLTGAIGGCRQVVTYEGQIFDSTKWKYSGDAASEKLDCEEDSMSTWVALP